MTSPGSTTTTSPWRLFATLATPVLTAIVDRRRRWPQLRRLRPLAVGLAVASLAVAVALDLTADVLLMTVQQLPV